MKYFKCAMNTLRIYMYSTHLWPSLYLLGKNHHSTVLHNRPWILPSTSLLLNGSTKPHQILYNLHSWYTTQPKKWWTCILIAFDNHPYSNSCIYQKRTSWQYSRWIMQSSSCCQHGNSKIWRRLLVSSNTVAPHCSHHHAHE